MTVPLFCVPSGAIGHVGRQWWGECGVLCAALGSWLFNPPRSSRMTRRPPLLRRRLCCRLQACARTLDVTPIVQCPAPSVPAVHDAAATALGLAADGCSCSGVAQTGSVVCDIAAAGQPLNPCQTSQTCTGLEVDSVSGQIITTQVQISVAPGATPIACTVPAGISPSRLFFQVSCCRVPHQSASRSPMSAPEPALLYELPRLVG